VHNLTKAHEYPPILEKYPNDPVNKLCLRNMWDEVKYNDQAIFDSVIGKMGSGKSWWCLYCGLVLSYNEKMEREFSVERNVIFDQPSYLKVIRKPAFKGEVLIYEEAETTVNAQEHYKDEVIMFSKIISTQRSRNPIALFNLPAETQIAASIRRLRLGQFVFKKAYKQLGFSTFSYQDLDYPMLANDYTLNKFSARLKRKKLSYYRTVDKECGLKIREKYNTLRFWKPKGALWDKTVKEYLNKKDSNVDALYDQYLSKGEQQNVVRTREKPITEIVKEIDLNIEKFYYPRTKEFNTFKIQEEFGIPETRALMIMRELKKKRRYLVKQEEHRKEFDLDSLESKAKNYFEE
jgi:hypothetical protein